MKRVLQRVVGGALLAAVLAGAAMSGGATAAPPPPVSCGQTITRDTVLRQDLVDCVGPALVIGAAGITLDLGGHTVRGATILESFHCEDTPGGGGTCHLCDAPGASPCGPPFATPGGHVEQFPNAQRVAGVDNSGGFDRVTIRHGTIDNYLYGARFVGADRLVARDLTEGEAFAAECTVCLEQSTNGVVRNIAGYTTLDQDSHGNLLDNAGYSIVVGGSHNTIRRSSSQIDVYGDANTIEQNRLEAFKALVISDSRGNVVRNNTIHAAEAIWLAGATETLVERNTVTGGGDTTYAIVLLNSDRNTIRRNVLRGTRPPAGEASSKGGIVLCHASGNTIEQNDITNMFVGIILGADSSCNETGLAGNVLRENTISDSRGDDFLPESTSDGILVGPLATNTLIENNTLARNGDDGIDVQNPTTILRRNTANRNGDLGIEALGGAVDGGRNTARGNGNPAQCVGVPCS